jgi:hypothetical protein
MPVTKASNGKSACHEFLLLNIFFGSHVHPENENIDINSQKSSTQRRESAPLHHVFMPHIIIQEVRTPILKLATTKTQVLVAGTQQRRSMKHVRNNFYILATSLSLKSYR